MTDTEAEQIVRDLRRRSVPGDPANRAAEFIERTEKTLNDGANDRIGYDVMGLNLDGRRAQEYVARDTRHRLPDDHAVRDMMTKETLDIIRQERNHELASFETKSDYEYIDLIGRINQGQYKHIAKMIALTARYAGELPHDLIHPTTRRRIEDRLRRGQYANAVDRSREVEAAITEMGGTTWETFVDPGLACNARIACSDIANRLPRLHGINVTHALNYMSGNAAHADMFTDFFCAVIACTWRFNSVMSAQPYKTKYEHASVQQALRIASLRLADFLLDRDEITHCARKPPRNVSELRGRGGAFA